MGLSTIEREKLTMEIEKEKLAMEIDNRLMNCLSIDKTAASLATNDLMANFKIEPLTDIEAKNTLKKVRHLMDCQRDCIESGNILTPSEQEAAIRAIEQLWERISGHFGLIK